MMKHEVYDKNGCELEIIFRKTKAWRLAQGLRKTCGVALLGVLLMSCSRPPNIGDEALPVTSTQYDIYLNVANNVVLEYSVDQYIEDELTIDEEYLRQYEDDEERIQEQLEDYREYLTGLSKEQIEDSMIDNQIEFLMQDLHFDRSSLQISGLVREELADGYTKASYSIRLQTLLEKGTSNLDIGQTTTMLPLRIHLASLAALYNAEQDCFDKESIEANRISNPIGWPAHLFYYFQSKSCTFTSPLWKQTVFDNQKIGSNKQKYPEYDKIWEDGLFEATLIFTPSSDFEMEDEGVRAYQNAIRYIIDSLERYNLRPSGSYRPALNDALANPETTLSYRLSSGSQIIFNFLLWTDNWHYDQNCEEQFQRLSSRSDYISYNGHAGYGDNVGRLEEWTQVEPGKYQIFYVDGCSTFSYLKDTMFKKRQSINPGSTPGQFLDLLSNVHSTYFGMMAYQNQMVIMSLLLKKSYYEICKTFDRYFDPSSKKKFDPSVIVSGEEDNIYKP